MIAYAGIEVAAAGHLEPLQTLGPATTPVKAPGGGVAGMHAAIASSSVVPGAESLRSSWQLMLASAGASSDELGAEAADTCATIVLAGSSSGKPVLTASAATASLLGRGTFSLRNTISRAGDSAACAAIGAGSGVRSGIPAWRTTSEAPRQAAAYPSLASTPSSRYANTARNAHFPSDSNATAAVQDGNLSQVAPAPEGNRPVAVPAEMKLRFSTMDSGKPPTGLGLDSIDPGKTAEKAGAAGDSAAHGKGAEPWAGSAASAPPAGGYAGSPEASLGRIEAGDAGKETSMAEPARPNADAPIEAVASGRNGARLGSEAQYPVTPQIDSQEGNRGLAPAESALQSATALAIAGKPGLVNGGRISALVGLRAAHGMASGARFEDGSRPLEGQPGLPPANSSLTASDSMRDAAGAPGTIGAAGSGAGTSPGAGPAAAETFAALDAEAAPGAHAWIHVGSQRAEAGFEDPALGWVGVRADVGTGGIHASLVPGTADAAKALGGHLAGLNSYLAERHTAVETLTLAAPEGGGPGSREDGGTNQGTQHGMNGGAGQDRNQGDVSEPQSISHSASPAQVGETSIESTVQARSLDGITRGPWGSHVSVMA
jgi:hypothetical protein